MKNNIKYVLLILMVYISVSASSQTDTVVLINMTDDLDYNPAEINIPIGETVVWENTSQLVHTVTFDPSEALDESHVQLPEGVEPFGSGKLNPGETFRYSFEKPGTYKYFCIPHESSGMLGKVIVTRNSKIGYF